MKKIKKEEVPNWSYKLAVYSLKMGMKRILKDINKLDNYSYLIEGFRNTQEWINFQDELNRISVKE